MSSRKLILVVLGAFAIKFWIYQPFIIPSSSMDSTLIQGDYLIVNKWQNSIFGDLLNAEKGNVIAFHYPLDRVDIKDKMVYIKRCVGMPGDTLVVENGLVTDNETQLQFDYIIEDPNSIINWGLLNKLGVHLGGRTTNNNWLLSLGKKQIDSLKRSHPELSFKKHLQPPLAIDLSVFPSDTSMRWNQDFYGPIYIPKKGDRIKLNTQNISLYTKIIEEYENHTLDLSEKSILINGDTIEEYTFGQDYYFMMGDNRHHSKDSRHWGFVPHDHLIGTCSFVLFNLDKFSEERLFKPIK